MREYTLQAGFLQRLLLLIARVWLAKRINTDSSVKKQWNCVMEKVRLLVLGGI
jgi:hypothetical protein